MSLLVRIISPYVLSLTARENRSAVVVCSLPLWRSEGRPGGRDAVIFPSVQVISQLDTCRPHLHHPAHQGPFFDIGRDLRCAQSVAFYCIAFVVATPMDSKFLPSLTLLDSFFLVPFFLVPVLCLLFFCQPLAGFMHSFPFPFLPASL